MFRMDNYLEKWACKYKLLSHQPETGSRGHRFYRIDAITSLKPFCENLTQAKSPSMAYITQVDATLAGPGEKFMMVSHRVFFLVKRQEPNRTNGITQELADADAKDEGAEMGEDLLAYLYDDKKNKKNEDLEGLDFKGAVVYTTPQQFNGWWPTEVVFSQLVPRNLCVNQEKYYD